jgi:hypothetical protein
MQFRNLGEGSRQCNAGTPKRWLMLSAFRLSQKGCWFRGVVSRMKIIREKPLALTLGPGDA